MQRGAIAIVFGVLLAFGASGARAASPPPPACSDGSPASEPIAFPEAFAHSIDDSPTLRFIAHLLTLKPRAQATVLANVRRLGLADTAISDVEIGCRTELAFRTLRVLRSIGFVWNVDQQDRAFIVLARRVERALATLDRDAALEPFGLRASDLAAAPDVGGICTKPESAAHDLTPREPAYPELARSSGTTGLIRLSVALDREGLVRAVTPSTIDVSGAGRDALVNSAIAAAGTSSYAPEISQCKPVAGSYTFTAEYRRN